MSEDSKDSETTSEQEFAPISNESDGGLADEGYRKTETECHDDDCEGTMWYDDHTLVCEKCSYTIDLDQRRRLMTLEDQWARYEEVRPTYHHSNRVRMPGGFLSAYDWVTADDIDGTVSGVDSESFYK